MRQAYGLPHRPMSFGPFTLIKRLSEKSLKADRRLDLGQASRRWAARLSLRPEIRPRGSPKSVVQRAHLGFSDRHGEGIVLWSMLFSLAPDTSSTSDG
jgi:hypothetical protein